MHDQIDSSPMEAGWHALAGEVLSELGNILHYWDQFAVDHQNGGFVGKIDQENKISILSPKGSVLNARILWSFSAAYNDNQDPRWLELATRAFHYIREYISDHRFGGLFWSVDHRGNMLDGHKQVYAQAFGIYAMAEFYRASGDTDALHLALSWYQLIEKYSRDPKHGGYIDAFSREWNFLEDKRLSEKDKNASKTMNTHLHIVEAYANLYTCSPSPGLKQDIIDLLKIFSDQIINPSGHHLGLFFSDDWQMDSAVISYGHDIEAGWLLQSCAEIIQDSNSITTAKRNALLITQAAMEGQDEDGGLWYEYDHTKKALIAEKHWWPQAEALVGFCNAWQLTQNPLYKNALLKTWRFISHYILDKNQGEWLWGVDANNTKMTGQDKVGFWKGPYHNSRACLELLKRLKA
jgi:cellobiose epimerase